MKPRVVAALAAITTALSGLAVAASSANAGAPAQTLYISTSSVAVHTSNGSKWDFGFEGSPTADDLTLNITRTTSGGTEAHYWDVPVPTSAVTFDPSTGQGTLKTPSSAAALTTINMNFTATSQHQVTCQSGSETDYVGDLNGRATLTTHLNGGGTVGGRHVSFKAGTTNLYADNNCVPPAPPSKCRKSVFFDAVAASYFPLSGSSMGATRSIEVSHQVWLAHPAGVDRRDYASARGSSAPVLNSSTKTLKVFGSNSGVVTGSGKIVTHKITRTSSSCTLHGAIHTEVAYVAETSHFTNTSGHPLVGHTSLTGHLTVANGASAYFADETWH